MLDKIGTTKYSRLYINIINKAKSLNRIKLKKTDLKYEYFEEHHILPKSVFPEYQDLIIFNWNGVLLSAREHFVCHLLIWKHYKKLNIDEQYKMSNAINLMNKWGKYNSNLYEHYKINLKKSEESKLKNANSHKGKKHGPKSESCKKIISDKLKLNNHLQKEYVIYNSNGEIIYEITTRFDTFCKENNLPFTAFRSSYLNDGEPIFMSTNKTRISKIKKTGLYHLKGYYAKYK